MKHLHISDELSLPLDFVTKTCGILAQRRKGKTYTASVIAEELVAAKAPWVALDPTGAWWGLRASADAKSAGLPVIIFGGQHADVPLERTGGKLVAEMVIDSPGFYIVDFSLFDSKEAERQFATDFAERLYRLKKQPNKNFAMHLFVDEADMFVPQQSPSGDKRMLGAFEALVRRGGLSGLGTTLISQRAAVVNKNVLEQLDLLIVLRNVGPNDRKAIDGYIQAKGSEEERREMMGSLASLKLGEAWVWEPGAEPPLFDRVTIRERHTFNSSATPKTGERQVEPRQLADVDLDVVTKRMAATIEKAKAEDPRELNKVIAELRKEIIELKKNATPREQDVERITKLTEELAAERAKVKPAGKSEVKEKRVVVAADLTRLEQLAERFDRQRDAFTELVTAQAVIFGTVEKTVSAAKDANAQELQVRGAATPASSPRARQTAGYQPQPTVRSLTAQLDKAPRAQVNGDFPLTKKQQEILNALAWLESIGINRPSNIQLGAVAMVDTSGGYFSNMAGPLSSQGLITRGSGTTELTDAGRELAVVPESIASLDEYHDMLRTRVRRVKSANGKSIAILDVLIENGGAEMSTQDIGTAVSVDHSGGYFSNSIGPLSTLGLIQRSQGMVRPTEILFPKGLV